MTDTTNTDTNTAHAAALAMRNAAAALARRLPLYYSSGESADEDLAQAIENLPLPDADTTDWKAEAERLRGLLHREQQERHAVLDRLDAAILARTASQARAELAQAREVLADCAETMESYARHHAERGPEHAHKVTRNAELAARCRAALAAKE